ncbi:copper amine oxidase N-terminal domain-containing protein [Oscillibacter sp. MSJ-2]|uniref:Copper amine oxidase N-terminal domain-containing protein n=1 Tax=Dysosmobacter acutus TaxID=2841504 RepID=A0ABS6F8L7_9FIRM|nr:copper amine oxidase N-terminal domain-containing protein [Dysosmobacter acutus]MBU5625644.1 copper amine oxidase N-terminal domain-containing protein [Dysosmobacter acutus]
MKKILSLALALVLALALAVPSFAVETTAQKDIQVVLNGESVAFPDAKPELTSGRTMVPYRALMETLGGEVEYVTGGTITCKLGDTTLSFEAGGKVVTKTGADGKAETIQMDVPCYIKAGRTYVPVRFFAQALGYDVFWDSDDRAAVLVDKDALIEEIDKNFTVLNEALAKLVSDPDKNYKTTATANIALSSKDETGAEVKFDMKMDMTMIQDKQSLEMDAKIDMSSLLEEMDLDAAVKSGAMTAEEAEAMRQMFSNITIKMIYDYKNDVIYMNMPMMDALVAEDTTVNGETWYKMSLGLGDLSELASSATVGRTIYMMEKMVANMDANAPAQLYDAVKADAAAASAFLGDNAYSKVGSTYQWSFDKSKLDSETASLFDDLSMTIKANSDGSMKMTFKMGMTQEGSSVSVSGDGTMTKDSATITMNMDMGEMGTAKITMDMKMAVTTEKPAIAPPTGAQITDLGSLDEMMNSLAGAAGTAA